MSIWCVAGLGNPGPSYEGTRHNAGWWWLDALAAQMGVCFKSDLRTGAALARGEWQSQDLLLLKPMLYMNLSGGPLAHWLRYLGVEVQHLIVVHDELDLPAGVVRYKVGGGLAGHNGLKDIAHHLHSQSFARIRIGIGRPEPPQAVVDYVLARPASLDLEKIKKGISCSVEHFHLLLRGQTDAFKTALQ